MAEPIRTCVGCRARARQRTLIRFVTRAGVLERDAVGRRGGRGAYLHARRACVDAFTRRGGFVRSLRCVVAKPTREQARAWFPEVYD